MTQKFHLTPDGPRPCEAEKRPCEYLMAGEPHFDNAQEAEAVHQQRLQQRHGLTPAAPAGERTVSTHVEGLNNNSYYGCSVPSSAVRELQQRWRAYMGKEEALRLEANKAARPSGAAFHVTALTPKETRKFKGKVPPAPEQVTVETVGVGTVTSQDGQKTAWYVVCRSPELQAWRESLGLPPKDLHITLGFEGGDVFDVFKGEQTLLQM